MKKIYENCLKFAIYTWCKRPEAFQPLEMWIELHKPISTTKTRIDTEIQNLWLLSENGISAKKVGCYDTTLSKTLSNDLIQGKLVKPLTNDYKSNVWERGKISFASFVDSQDKVIIEFYWGILDAQGIIYSIVSNSNNPFGLKYETKVWVS